MNVLGAGLITVDIIQLCKSGWQPYEETVGYYSGGTAANILSYLGRFGWNVSVFGGIGDDVLGEILKHDLEGFNVDVSGITVNDGLFTRRISHLVSQDTNNYGSHKFDTNCSRCKIEFPPFDQRKNKVNILKKADDLIDQETILLIDRANELTLNLAKKVSAAGGVIVFEPGYLSSNALIVNELITYVDLFKYSEELHWAGKPFRINISRELPKLKVIIETRGKKGVRLMKSNKQIRLTTTPILKVEDSAGAGDAFMAGFLSGIERQGLLHLDDVDYDLLEDAISRGQALGGLACKFIGSKGILLSKKVHQIEDAISMTRQTLEPPADFSSSVMPKGMVISETPGLCKICHLPLV